MGIEIKVWQIINGKLTPIDTDLKIEGRTEPYDLEPWLESNPEIIGEDIMIIGRQVPTKSGSIDLLGIDKSGNTVIIEIKRDELPRESLAQAIDYASNVAEWDGHELNAVYSKYTKNDGEENSFTLEDALVEAFTDIDLKSLPLNSIQRIILVGFSIGVSLERMTEWLSDSYGVNINAIVLSYAKTKGKEENELLMRTSIISEERKGRTSRGFAMSDEPGSYEKDVLKEKLLYYLSRDRVSNTRIRDVLVPTLLKVDLLKRDALKKAFGDSDPKVGYYLALISVQLGLEKNDFLRQVIKYEYPNHSWEKDNFSIRPKWRDLVNEVLEELKDESRHSGTYNQ